MSEETPAAADAQTREMCDHICLKDAGHVERGEPHFYGYEHPSPRRLTAELAALTAERDELKQSRWEIDKWWMDMLIGAQHEIEELREERDRLPGEVEPSE